MTHKLGNLIRQSSLSTGDTTVALTGPPVAPYRLFSSLLSNGDTTEAMVLNQANGEWQHAIYSYASNVLTFVRWLSSSSGFRVNFSAGTKDVYIAPAAERGRWFKVDSAFDAIAGDRINADTTGGGFTVALPSGLADGDEFYFNDFAGTWPTNSLTIDGNGHQFKLEPDPVDRLICNATARIAVVYADGYLTIRRAT